MWSDEDEEDDVVGAEDTTEEVEEPVVHCAIEPSNGSSDSEACECALGGE